jgi:hypothetical protein
MCPPFFVHSREKGGLGSAPKWWAWFMAPSASFRFWPGHRGWRYHSSGAQTVALAHGGLLTLPCPPLCTLPWPNGQHPAISVASIEPVRLWICFTAIALHDGFSRKANSRRRIRHCTAFMA